MAAVDHPIPRDDPSQAASYVGKIWTPMEIEAELDRLREVVGKIIDYLVIVDRETTDAKRVYDIGRARALINTEGRSEKMRLAEVDADAKVIELRAVYEVADHVTRMTRERLKEAYQAIDIVRSISASIGRSVPTGNAR